MVLRCGVPRPAALTPTSMLITVDGVDWFVEQPTVSSEPVRFTATGRRAYVEVLVAGPRSSAVDPLVDLAAAVTRTDPKVTTTG